jgi:hypothetical protein
MLYKQAFVQEVQLSQEPVTILPPPPEKKKRKKEKRKKITPVLPIDDEEATDESDDASSTKSATPVETPPVITTPISPAKKKKKPVDPLPPVVPVKRGEKRKVPMPSTIDELEWRVEEEALLVGIVMNNTPTDGIPINWSLISDLLSSAVHPNDPLRDANSCEQKYKQLEHVSMKLNVGADYHRKDIRAITKTWTKKAKKVAPLKKKKKKVQEREPGQLPTHLAPPFGSPAPLAPVAFLNLTFQQQHSPHIQTKFVREGSPMSFGYTTPTNDNGGFTFVSGNNSPPRKRARSTTRKKKDQTEQSPPTVAPPQSFTPNTANIMMINSPSVTPPGNRVPPPNAKRQSGNQGSFLTMLQSPTGPPPVQPPVLQGPPPPPGAQTGRQKLNTLVMQMLKQYPQHRGEIETIVKRSDLTFEERYKNLAALKDQLPQQTAPPNFTFGMVPMVQPTPPPQPTGGGMLQLLQGNIPQRQVNTIGQTVQPQQPGNTFSFSALPVATNLANMVQQQGKGFNQKDQQ